MRSLRAPPPVIRDVLEGVLRLMGIFDMSWTSMKSFLGKRTIKEEILNFDARNVTPQIRESVSELLRSKPDSFDEATVKRSSVAAAPLAIWVRANLEFSRVLDKIRPLEEDLARVTRTLQDSKDKVELLATDLSSVDAKVATLKDRFAEKTRAAEILRLHLEKAQATITAAEHLLDNLQGERARWTHLVTEFREKMERLPMNAMLAAAITVYFGGLQQSVRKALLKEYLTLFGNEQAKFDYTSFVLSESEVLQWKQSGLPDDALTVQNIVISLQSSGVPFVIDPTGRITQWMLQAQTTSTDAASAKVEAVQQQDPNLSRTIELAVRFGKSLIIENITKLEPFLIPLLRQEFQKQGARKVVRFGDKILDIHDEFRLVLASKNPVLEIPEDIRPHLAKLDFTTTIDGLKTQLLSIVLNHEKPELEQQRRELVSKEQSLKMELIARMRRGILIS